MYDRYGVACDCDTRQEMSEYFLNAIFFSSSFLGWGGVGCKGEVDEKLTSKLGLQRCWYFMLAIQLAADRKEVPAPCLHAQSWTRIHIKTPQGFTM